MKYLGKRKPNKDERERGAEIVFEWIDRSGDEVDILACKCYESWEQWGAIKEMLSANVINVELWRNGLE